MTAVLVHRWRIQAGHNQSNCLTLRIGHRISLPRHPFVGQLKANQLPANTFLFLLEQRFSPDESCLKIADPAQVSLDWGNLGRDFMAVQRKSRLKAQTVPGRQPYRLDLDPHLDPFLQNSGPHNHSLLGRKEDFYPILPGVTGPPHDGLDPGNLVLKGAEAGHAGQICRGELL